MIALARRYCGAILACLAIAVAAIALHRVAARRFDPCADPAQLAHLEAFGRAPVLREHVEFGGERDALWVDGVLPSAVRNGSPLLFRFVRVDEPYPIYGRFDLFLIDAVLPEDRSERRTLRVGSDALPVHRRFDDSLEEFRLTHYFFASGVRPVWYPLPSGVADVWRQLVRGTEPVSVFIVTGVADAATLAAVEARAESWLAAAWTDYRRACRL